jgi:hypothetical protein
VNLLAEANGGGGALEERSAVRVERLVAGLGAGDGNTGVVDGGGDALSTATVVGTDGSANTELDEVEGAEKGRGRKSVREKRRKKSEVRRRTRTR